MTQERMTDHNAGKADENTKADISDASDDSNASKINTPKIDVSRGILKPCDIAISLYQNFSLRQQVLHYARSGGEGSDTGKFDAKKEAKKEATKANAKQKSDAILTYRRLYLIQKALRETHNLGLGGGEDSEMGGKDIN